MSNNLSLRQRAGNIAHTMLSQMYGEDRAKTAAGRISIAIASARAGARNASDFDRAAAQSPASLAQCVAVSAATELYPGGPNPPCYIIPQGGRLNWRLSHRGVCILASRAGYHVQAVPVHVDDPLIVAFGQVTDHEYRDDPMTLEELAGVIVVVRRIGDPEPLVRNWVSIKRILERKRKTRTGPVWNSWPVEMAMKTAILYSAARGTMPVESAEWQHAIAEDMREPEPVTIARPAVVAPLDALQIAAGDVMAAPPGGEE